MESTSNTSELTAVSPLDGRYAKQSACLREYFSEYALIKHRVIVEIKWFITLYSAKIIEDAEPLDEATLEVLDKIITDFNVEEAQKVKDHEAVTQHDVKAVEYYLKDKFDENEYLKARKEFLHFTCTSEDINNLGYAIMIKHAIDNEILPNLEK